MGLFPDPKKPSPPPPTPTQADASVMTAGQRELARAAGAGSLVGDSGSSALKRKASTQKSSLIGGST